MRNYLWIVVFIFTTTLFGTNPVEYWDDYYGADGNNTGVMTKQFQPGSFICAGVLAQEDNSGMGDAWLFKLNLEGTIVWSASVGESMSDSFSDVDMTPDGGYIAVGGITPDGETASNTLIVRFDSSGNILWLYNYGGIYNDYAKFVHAIDNDHFVIGSETCDNTDGYEDYWLFEIDSSGDILWSHTYGDAGHQRLLSATATADGGYIMSGISGIQYQNEQIYLVKTDGEGNLEWQETIGESYDERAHCIHQTSDGGYVISGYCLSGDGSSCMILKLNSEGAQEWRREIDSSNYEAFFGFDVLPDDGLIMTGFHQNNDTGTLWLKRLDAQGNDIWDWYKDSLGEERGYSVCATPNGYFTIGYTKLDSSHRYIFAALVNDLSADFTGAPLSGIAPLTVQFTSPCDGNAESYQWDFNNDGIIDSTEPNPSWIYTQPGFQTVSLTVYDGISTKLKVRQSYINVAQNAAPVITYYYPTVDSLNVDAGTEQSFFITATDTDSLTYHWAVNGVPQTSMEPAMSYAFDTTSDYLVACDISDGINTVTQSWNVHVNVSVGDPAIPVTAFGVKLYPNPCMNRMNLDLSLPNGKPATVTIYNCRGEQVRRVDTESIRQGHNLLLWDTKDQNGKRVASGVYFVRCVQDGHCVQAKAFLLR